MILYNQKEYKRAIVIGDIHSCVKELLQLLDKTKPTDDDLIISVGDVCDRGPSPVECYQLLFDIDAVVVKGNHELKHQSYWEKDLRAKLEPGYKNQMQPFTGVRLEEHKQIMSRFYDKIKDFPPFIKFSWLYEDIPINTPKEYNVARKISDYLVVHAGFFPHIPYQKQDIKTMCRLRYVTKDSFKMIPYRPGQVLPEGAKFWDELWPGPENVIYGHEVHSLDKPRVIQHNGYATFSIDTGACFNGNLTAMIINQDNQITYEQVKAAREYCVK